MNYWTNIKWNNNMFGKVKWIKLYTSKAIKSYYSFFLFFQSCDYVYTKENILFKLLQLNLKNVLKYVI